MEDVLNYCTQPRRNRCFVSGLRVCYEIERMNMERNLIEGIRLQKELYDFMAG
ncbi:MAG: hypothetical protein FWG74_03030 [Planctomycetes bacterium]|nr:hypothetical protein [Planctomycetota bacterium]